MLNVTDNTLKRLSLSLKTLAGVVCLWAAVSGKYPPAHAQHLPAPDQVQIPQQMTISPYDPEFASDIKALNLHLAATDTNVKELESLKGDVREMQTNMKWYFWIIGGLLSGSIVIPNLKGMMKGKENE